MDKHDLMSIGPKTQDAIRRSTLPASLLLALGGISGACIDAFVHNTNNDGTLDGVGTAMLVAGGVGIASALRNLHTSNPESNSN